MSTVPSRRLEACKGSNRSLFRDDVLHCNSSQQCQAAREPLKTSALHLTYSPGDALSTPMIAEARPTGSTRFLVKVS